MTNSEKLTNFLSVKNIDAKIIKISSTFPIEKFYLKLGPKAELSQLAKLSKEIGLLLMSVDAPIITPNYKLGLVTLVAMLGTHPIINFHENSNKAFQDCNKKIPIYLGNFKVVMPLVLDLQSLPHLLIGGTTGSGKSMMLHSIINSIIRNSVLKNIKLLLMDPKQVEFAPYKKQKCLDASIANTSEECSQMMASLILEMEKRFKVLGKYKCRDIIELREKKGAGKMPYKVLVIDELGSLVETCSKLFMSNLIQLSQKSRAVGIHIVVALQHPSAKVVPGNLKANFPCRIGCKVASAIHSRVLFDVNGAEKLLGKGDAIIDGNIFSMHRFQGALVDSEKIEKSKENGIMRGAWNAIFN